MLMLELITSLQHYTVLLPAHDGKVSNWNIALPHVFAAIETTKIVTTFMMMPGFAWKQKIQYSHDIQNLFNE